MDSTIRKNMVYVTLISAVFFTSLLILITLSPLNQTGPNVNQFNSTGMWLAVGMVLFCYLFPLLVYIRGVQSMKMVMAILCGVGLLIALSVLPIIGWLLYREPHPTTLTLLVLGLLLCITNIIWFFSAFMRSSRPPTMS
ncbi:DUF5391 domain-containing protein [Mechercharimyces sp. CAU 1602]|uniref:DUF5391 domain-containing protein n=1 Tax=Mechercharimyces sp. CAU 1602 TaxID=2973933 RepID=UPI002162C7CC|nr:DUF5391 domain-containing protein [Mechercharimyces sp. CAU 1602]MCS1351034.1 DUF5391 domain-containing protein [Mechercharimyces sp. CAU 1602]